MPDNYDLDPCVICNEPQTKTILSSFDGIHQICPRCGEFKMSGRALTTVSQTLGSDKRAKLSGWVLEQYRSGSVPMINGSNINSILSRPLPSVIVKKGVKNHIHQSFY